MKSEKEKHSEKSRKISLATSKKRTKHVRRLRHKKAVAMNLPNTQPDKPPEPYMDADDFILSLPQGEKETNKKNTPTNKTAKEIATKILGKRKAKK
jgi:hypothetical protein